MKNQLFPLCLVCFIALFSCQSSDQFIIPPTVLKEDSLILVLKDIHIIDAAAKQNFIPNNADNYNKYREYKFVLEKYNVSRARFDSTISFYSSHPKEFEEIYTKIIEELKSEDR